jgi:hypothetical protein
MKYSSENLHLCYYDVYFHTNSGVSHRMLDKRLNRLCLEAKTFSFICNTSLFLIIFDCPYGRQRELRFLRHCLKFLYFSRTNMAWDIALRHYFLCFFFFVQSHVIVWLSLFCSSALLKSCNFDVSPLEQMPIRHFFFSDIASLVTCCL